MTIICDTHTHSKFSPDSEAEIEDICRSAISKGLKVLCITDHIDFDKRDASCGLYKMKEYFNEIHRCRELYKDKLILLSGIEFSEPHLYPDELREIASENYDMIIGSVHWIKYGFVGDPQSIKTNSREDIEDSYYSMLERAIEHGGFDTLAHFDVPKRYFGSPSKLEESFVERLLSKLIENGIALEINTSSLRRGTDQCMPGNDVIDKYIKLGGDKITIGSDAHIAKYVMSDFSEIPHKYHPYIGVYVKRKFVRMFDI